MYQLAGLASIVDLYRGRGGVLKKVYAQDPVFNSLDKTLLATLGITVVEHPAVFDLVVTNKEEDEKIFLYCPGAEIVHIQHLISSSESIAMLFGNSLNGDSFANFVASTESIRVPSFEPCEHAFWDVRLYYHR